MFYVKTQIGTNTAIVTQITDDNSSLRRPKKATRRKAQSFLGSFV